MSLDFWDPFINNHCLVQFLIADSQILWCFIVLRPGLIRNGLPATCGIDIGDKSWLRSKFAEGLPAEDVGGDVAGGMVQPELLHDSRFILCWLKQT